MLHISTELRWDIILELYRLMLVLERRDTTRWETRHTDTRSMEARDLSGTP